jgi:ABC-type glycerol-3-phosphate transport system substrate-binding protein
VRRITLFVLVAVLAGCGGSSKPAAVTSAATPKPGPGQVLYRGGNWAVVLSGGKAEAQHLVAGTWQADTTGLVKVAILGPHGTVAATPQVAAELSAGAPLVESGLWVDGTQLLVKGGGLRPTRGTIYGAPGAPLEPGKHVAVAYARTADHATAVAWSFRVG